MLPSTLSRIHPYLFDSLWAIKRQTQSITNQKAKIPQLYNQIGLQVLVQNKFSSIKSKFQLKIQAVRIKT